MDYRVIKYRNVEILEVDAASRISSEADALDCVAACGEEGTTNLLLNDLNFPDDFFRLRTGLAGEILLRFSVYRLRVAILVTTQRPNQGRFRDMVLEANRGRQLGFFDTRESALEWFQSK